MVEERLCPGTSINVRFCSSLVGATRGRVGDHPSLAGSTKPARSAAARVVRGWIDGTAVVEGTDLALNPSFPLDVLPVLLETDLSRDCTCNPFWLLLPMTSSCNSLIFEARAYSTWSYSADSSAAIAGNGGLETNKAPIWSSAA